MRHVIQKARAFIGKKAGALSGETDENRRKFLKILMFGGGFFVAGKMFGDIFNFFTAEAGNTVYFRNFRVTENKKTLGVYDVSGDEILIIDKDL